MKINGQLKQIRENYLAIEPPSDFKKYGWVALRKEIEAHERHRFVFLPIFARNIIFATITLILLGGGFVGLVKASQSSLPGDTLYPLKRLTENFTTVILGDQQVKLEKRAEEVVGVAREKNDPALLEQTVKNYQEAVAKTKQAVENTSKKDEFQKTLKKQEQQFKDVSEQIPILKDVLEEAMEASKKGREGEVKKSDKIKEEIKATEKEIKGVISK